MAEPRSLRPFEEAKPEDAASLAALAAEAGVPGWSEASLASTLRDSGRIALLVRGEASAPLGFVIARPAADEVEILLVVVARSARRRGLARGLLAAALERADAARVAHLEVRVSNAAAIALYEQQGFVAVGRRPRYYEGAEDAISMRRRLRESVA